MTCLIYIYIYILKSHAWLRFSESLQGVGGDIIDCVDIYQQPAFDHPFLKNHAIQVCLLDFYFNCFVF